MQRAHKLQVNIGADHIVKLPSDVPEGPAEMIVIPRAASVPQEQAAARLAAMGRYQGEAFFIADDFDAPLPTELLSLFEGDKSRGQ
jgi:hypothetical protein